MSRSLASTPGKSALTTSSCSFSWISTAGAQVVRFDSWLVVRSKASLNKRLIWSCRVAWPRKAVRVFIVCAFLSVINDYIAIILYECLIVKYEFWPFGFTPPPPVFAKDLILCGLADDLT